MRGGWVSTCWHHACVESLLWLLPSRGALESERPKTWPVARCAYDPVPMSPELILTVRSMGRREFFLDQIDTTGWGLLPFSLGLVVVIAVRGTGANHSLPLPGLWREPCPLPSLWWVLFVVFGLCFSSEVWWEVLGGLWGPWNAE